MRHVEKAKVTVWQRLWRCALRNFEWVIAKKAMDYSPLMAATPGSTLPSMASSMAPPPVET